MNWQRCENCNKWENYRPILYAELSLGRLVIAEHWEIGSSWQPIEIKGISSDDTLVSRHVEPKQQQTGYSILLETRNEEEIESSELIPFTDIHDVIHLKQIAVDWLRGVLSNALDFTV